MYAEETKEAAAKLTVTELVEVWDRWQQGESSKAIDVCLGENRHLCTPCFCATGVSVPAPDAAHAGC